MSLLQWEDKYSIGVPAIDHEHRQIIDLINALYEDLVQSHSEDRTRKFLGELYARISGHFALEEKMMRDIEYDHYEEHKADHERLLDELRDIMDTVVEGKTYNDEQLAQRLVSWFKDTFGKEEARLHKRLES